MVRYFEGLDTLDALIKRRHELNAEIQKQFNEQREYLQKHMPTFRQVQIVKQEDIINLQDYRVKSILEPSGTNPKSPILTITIDSNYGLANY